MSMTIEARPQYLNTTEAARFAGISVVTLRRWITAGKVRTFRPNRRVLVDAESLDAFIRGEAATGETAQ